MTTRSQSTTIVFAREFMLKVVGRTLPPGSYKVTTEEEQIEYLSFPAYRRVSTVIFVPTRPGSSSEEMYQVDPLALKAAQERDMATLGAERSSAALATGSSTDRPRSDIGGGLASAASPRHRSALAKAGFSFLRSGVDDARKWLRDKATRLRPY